MKNYDTFNFNKFNINYLENSIKIEYEYEIVNLDKFIHTLEFPYSNKDLNKEYINKLAFNIGMLELVSYWKLTCSKNVNILCGKLNEEQVSFFKKVYFYGLGEFFYTNNIKTDINSFMSINSNGDEYNTEIEYSGTGNIIGIGGGKDSCVTLELLKNDKNNACFIINPKDVQLECAKLSNFKEIYIIKRVLDKKIVEYNKKGFLNGHTPFSAMVSFVSFLLAYLNNKENIILSNESSANQVNVLGTKINHQYSKSYEYELDFQKYSHKYLNNNINYFSLLRPLSEYQIGLLFSEKCTKYHQVFKSCNVGSKSIPWKWCCKCAKCLFVYSLLSPHLYKEKLVDIFKEDLFEDKELLTIFKELLGKENVKPFDCVGTFEEIEYAITKCIKNLGDTNLPFLLQYYKDNYYNENILKMDLENYYDNENSLNEYYTKIVKDALYDR